jgi:hypothetical protein
LPEVNKEKIMRKLMFIVVAMVIATACAPSNEDQIASITAELEEQGIADYCNVSIGTLNGEKAYVIATQLVVREDNFSDCILCYCIVLGCVGRAIESDEGILRVVTASMYMDMPMSGVHYCLSVPEDDLLDALDENLEWVDR